MKIGPSDIPSVYPSVTESGTAPARPARTPATPAGGESTSINLSSVSTQLQALELKAAEGDFDAGKVEAIKQAIADGEFRVDAGRVADKLIADVREMIGQ